MWKNNNKRKRNVFVHHIDGVTKAAENFAELRWEIFSDRQKLFLCNQSFQVLIDDSEPSPNVHTGKMEFDKKKVSREDHAAVADESSFLGMLNIANRSENHVLDQSNENYLNSVNCESED
jgi:hypothetical protein